MQFSRSQAVLSFSIVVALVTAGASLPSWGATRYKHLLPEMEDKISASKDMDAWATAYRKGNLKLADTCWKKISAQVKPYDGFGPLLKVAHMRFVFSDDETPYDGLALDKHILRNTESELGPNHPAVADTLNYLCMAYSSRNKWADAEQVARRMVAIYDKTLDERDDRRAEGPAHLASVLRRENKMDEARKLANEAQRLWQKYPRRPRGDGGFQMVFPGAGRR